MDERLRGLERRWLETGSVEDEASLLAERARRGLLPATRLRLAAFLGHEAARTVVGAAPDPPRDPRKWASELKAFEKAAIVVGLASVAEARQDDWSAWAPGDERPRRALQATRAWLACPCDEHERAAGEAHAEAFTAYADLLPVTDRKAPARRLEPSRREAAVRAQAAADAASEAAASVSSPNARQACERLLHFVRTRDDVEGIRRALLAWALGSPTSGRG